MNDRLTPGIKSPINETKNVDSHETEAYKATQYLLRRKIPPWLYYKMRTFSRQYPLLFLPFSRWRWTRWRQKYCLDPSIPEPAAPEPLTRDTKIVIEGFPRTANTFAHVAFKMAQDKYVKIGHHTHAAAQVIAAAKMNIPTIVLIRDPQEAILSYLIGNFDPQISMKQVIQDYICFYKPILPYKSKFILASFEEITTDYGAVILRVNEKFNTDFQEFNHSEENVKRCFELVDEGYQMAFGELKENVVSRPSAARKVLKDKLQQQFQSEHLSKVREKAYKVYQSLMI